MILDLFILLITIAIVLLIVAYMERTISLTALSLLFWIFVFALSMYIEVPYVAAVSVGDTVNFTEGAHEYSEVALSIVIFGVIIFNILLLIVEFFEYSLDKRFRV